MDGTIGIEQGQETAQQPETPVTARNGAAEAGNVANNARTTVWGRIGGVLHGAVDMMKSAYAAYDRLGLPDGLTAEQRDEIFKGYDQYVEEESIKSNSDLFLDFLRDRHPEMGWNIRSVSEGLLSLDEQTRETVKREFVQFVRLHSNRSALDMFCDFLDKKYPEISRSPVTKIYLMQYRNLVAYLA